MPEVAWFGVEVPPTEPLMPVIIASGTPKFLAANWGRGFAVAMPEKFAERFRKLAESRGWSLKRIEPPELPLLRYYDALTGVWPVKPELSTRHGGVVAEVKRGGAYRKLLASIDRQYTVIVAPGTYIRHPMPADAAQARASAEAYKVAVVGFPFVFDEREGSAKLAEKVAKLKIPRPRGWFTPLDIENLLARTREGGMYKPKLKIAELMDRELGRAFSVPVAGNLTFEFREGADNSLLLCGAPGTGKSTVLDTILAQVPESWSALVLDPTGEHAILGRLGEKGYAVLRAGVDVRINPLSLGSATAFDVLKGVIEGYWREPMTAAKGEVLRRALFGAKNLAEVFSEVERALESSDEGVRNAAASLIWRLEPLLSCPALYGSERAEPLPTGRVVIDMSTIESEEGKAAFALTALHLVYSGARLGKWRGIVVIEEADRLGDCEVVNRIADELRKYKVSAWAVGHSLARIAAKLADARYQLYFATSDPSTLKVKDPDGEILPRLAFAQALAYVRGYTPFTTSLFFEPEVARSKDTFKHKPPIPVTAVAAKHGVDPRALAAAFSRGTCEALRRFLAGAASREDTALLDGLRLRRERELTKLGEACLELCRETGV
jgi:hypothetical protein